MARNFLAQVDIGSQFGSPFGGTQGKTFGDLVSVILSNALVAAGLVFMAILIIGGISIIASAGDQNPEKAAKGQQAVMSALVGFGIIFASYWIIQIIETMTDLNIFNPGF